MRLSAWPLPVRRAPAAARTTPRCAVCGFGAACGFAATCGFAAACGFAASCGFGASCGFAASCGFVELRAIAPTLSRT
jgi:hypothetical protein